MVLSPCCFPNGATLTVGFAFSGSRTGQQRSSGQSNSRDEESKSRANFGKNHNPLLLLYFYWRAEDPASIMAYPAWQFLQGTWTPLPGLRWQLRYRPVPLDRRFSLGCL
jgi:hypothetical protein